MVTAADLDHLSDDELEPLYDAGLISDDMIEQLIQRRLSPRELAIIDGIAYGIARFFNTPINQLVDEANADSQKMSLARGPAYNPAVNEHALVPHDPTQIGNWLPFMLGLPLGALGGYEYHKWRDAHPGKTIPWISGEPWQSIVGQEQPLVGGYPWETIVGGQWVDIVGSQPWQTIVGKATPAVERTQALLDQMKVPRESYGDVLSLDQRVSILAMWLGDALRGQYRGAFQISGQPSVGALPWKSIVGNRPLISGESWQSIVGNQPRIGAAIDVLRRQAQAAAESVASPAIIVLRDQFNQWQIGQFRSVDEAIGKFARLTADTESFTYASLYNKSDPHFPRPFDEVLGSARGPSGPPTVGALPWQSIVGRDPNVGAYPWASIHDVETGPRFLQRGPWIDIVGADADAIRRREWPRNRALIQSAVHDVLRVHRVQPAAAYVWLLESWGAPRYGAFGSYEEALAYARELGDNAAHAVFDRSSPHWPSPVTWHKSDDPQYEEAIAQQLGRYRGTSVSGYPWSTIVGSVIDVLRRQAQTAAETASGGAVIVLRDQFNRWQIGQFRSVDTALVPFSRVTADDEAFQYAALYNKADPHFPRPFDEVFGTARARVSSGPPTIVPLGAA